MSDKRAILVPENLLASRRREEMKERMRDGRHNFHLEKLPATIKIRWKRAEQKSRLCGIIGAKKKREKSILLRSNYD